MRKALVFATILLTALAVGVSTSTEDAAAYREPQVQPGNGTEDWLETGFLPGGQIEGACGVAVQSAAQALFVSDYYHRAIHTYTTGGTYEKTEKLAGGDHSPATEYLNTLNGACGLAVDSEGHLYVEEFHGRVMSWPDEKTIDAGNATGIAIGEGGDLYVDDRTYIAVYDAPVMPGEMPASKIGVGSLENGYGVAVDAKSGRVYVPDAAKETVKIFEPAKNLSTPVDTLKSPPGGFKSLVDASLAVDESETEGEGHVLVVDDLKRGFPFPQAAIDEFASDGSYLDQLRVRCVGPVGAKRDGPIFGEPSGIAVNQANGDLYVTTGNSEEANVVKYGQFLAEAPVDEGCTSLRTSRSSALAESPRGSGIELGGTDHAVAGASAAVIERRRGVQVRFDGTLTPDVLPRHGTAPVGMVIDASISATKKGVPPQLRRITVAINRHGHFTSTGLPICRVDQIQPSTTANALAACRNALVGEGRFSANVKLPQQSPFPSAGKVLAFNGKVNGHPAVLAHIYGTQPVPTSIVLPFLLRGGHGAYGTTLEASLPQATGNWGYVTGLRMNLRRRFSYRGKQRSFLSAGCPAPPGFPSASFPLAKTKFSFVGGLTFNPVLNRTCKARG